MKRVYLFAITLFFIACITCRAHAQDFNNLSDNFIKGYKSLHIPELQLSYVNGLKMIKSADSVQLQISFFKTINTQLAKFNPEKLTTSDNIDFKIIKYETGINLKRLSLEQQWISAHPENISDKGIYTVPNGKAWYAYLLQKWVGDDITPDQIYQFGLNEVKRVQQHIAAIRRQTGLSEDAFYQHLNDPVFFNRDSDVVQRLFENTGRIIKSHLSNQFNNYVIPPLEIKKGEEAALAQTPGYYNDNTFYYNLFNKPYNKRHVDWLFIHEAIPGHHFQTSISNQSPASAVQKLFYYVGFAEGWGAYAEELGKQLGVYKTPYDELGKWEWDIVRSVRVPLDVGINYYGWSDKQALKFWKQHIRNQDDIAMREINRIKRWPAQVVTYKYGAAQIMRWKETRMKKDGSNFSIKRFHDKVLNHGSMPLFMVRESVLDEI